MAISIYSISDPSSVVSGLYFLDVINVPPLLLLHIAHKENRRNFCWFCKKYCKEAYSQKWINWALSMSVKSHMALTVIFIAETCLDKSILSSCQT